MNRNFKRISAIHLWLQSLCDFVHNTWFRKYRFCQAIVHFLLIWRIRNELILSWTVRQCSHQYCRLNCCCLSAELLTVVFYDRNLKPCENVTKRPAKRYAKYYIIIWNIYWRTTQTWQYLWCWQQKNQMLYWYRISCCKKITSFC